MLYKFKTCYVINRQAIHVFIVLCTVSGYERKCVFVKKVARCKAVTLQT